MKKPFAMDDEPIAKGFFVVRPPFLCYTVGKKPTVAAQYDKRNFKLVEKMRLLA
jgi:hypothetical protein